MKEGRFRPSGLHGTHLRCLVIRRVLGLMTLLSDLVGLPLLHVEPSSTHILALLIEPRLLPLLHLYHIGREEQSECRAAFQLLVHCAASRLQHVVPELRPLQSLVLHHRVVLPLLELPLCAVRRPQGLPRLRFELEENFSLRGFGQLAHGDAVRLPLAKEDCTGSDLLDEHIHAIFKASYGAVSTGNFGQERFGNHPQPTLQCEPLSSLFVGHFTVLLLLLLMKEIHLTLDCSLGLQSLQHPVLQRGRRLEKRSLLSLGSPTEYDGGQQLLAR